MRFPIIRFLIFALLIGCSDRPLDHDLTFDFVDGSEIFEGNVRSTWKKKGSLEPREVALLRELLAKNEISDLHPGDDSLTATWKNVGTLLIAVEGRKAEFRMYRGEGDSG